MEGTQWYLLVAVTACICLDFALAIEVNIKEPDQSISADGLRRTHQELGKNSHRFDKNPNENSLRRDADLRLLTDTLSTPEECIRTCEEDATPLICYYHFTLEYYTVLGGACQLCTPNDTNILTATCQCVLADGVEKGILTANRMVPGPSIQVCEGDKVVIDVQNNIPGMAVTLHWHGLFQNGYQYYDGVPFVTQCPILEGNTFRYQWVAENAGTHFWHSHDGLQKIDGLSGSIIVRQPASEDPNSDEYDYDFPIHVLEINDWFHEYSIERYPGRLISERGQAPGSMLINGKGRYTDPNTGNTTNTPLEIFTVTPGKRYRFRMINSFGSVCPAIIAIQSHNLTVIASDGVSVIPVNVNSIISYSGERYDFVISADQTPGAYWIQLKGLGECGIEKAQQLGIIVYDGSSEQPTTAAPTYDDGLPTGVVLNPLDAICHTPREDAICVSQLQNAEEVDEGIFQEEPDMRIYLPFRFYRYSFDVLFQPNTYKRFLVPLSGNHLISLINNISFVAPPAPPLSQAVNPGQFCNGHNKPPNCGEDCMCTHMIDIPLNAVVEIVLLDQVSAPNLSHPFHLHGYAFNVIGMGRAADHSITKMDLENFLELDRQGLIDRRLDDPPAKDTIAVPNNGYVLLRFVANNPGYWFFHCHFLYHIVVGMNLILHVGTRRDLPPVPPGFPTCGNYVPPISPLWT